MRGIGSCHDLVMFNRSRVKAQLSMYNEGRHGFFEDIGTQVSIKSNVHVTSHWL